MLIAATTECFKHLSFDEAVQRMSDLEFTCIEIAIHEESQQLTPAQVAEDLEKAIHLCHNPNRLHVVAYSVKSSTTGDEFYSQFDAICRLARATRVVSVTIDSGELGTPFNEEVERLRELVGGGPMGPRARNVCTS